MTTHTTHIQYDSMTTHLSGLRRICIRLLTASALLMIYHAIGSPGPDIKILISESASGLKPDVQWNFSISTLERWTQEPIMCAIRAIIHILLATLMYWTIRQLKNRIGWPCHVATILLFLLGIIAGPVNLYIFGVVGMDAWLVWCGKQHGVGLIYVTGVFKALVNGSIFLAASWCMLLFIRKSRRFNKIALSADAASPHISQQELL